MFKGNGAFRESALSQRYGEYLARKIASGESPRPRAEWYEWSSFFGEFGPTARGNRFNNRSADQNWYPFHEVHLANGKRLDSYIHGREIVSRKAIDFDELTTGDLRVYLSEFSLKYSAGTLIRSNKYAFLDGKPLSGQYILEVPDSNLAALNRSIFEQAATMSGVRIRYRPE